jgi:esterase/lipase
MGEAMSVMSCVCGTITIIEELIEIRAKMRNQDASAMDDLLKLIKNYDKYSKKEKKMIRHTMEIFLQQNISLNGLP